MIKSNPDFQKGLTSGADLFVAEMFGDTIQGEGFSTGVPATFLRVQNCTLNCSWCDSQTVWKFGNPYSINEILTLWEENGFVEKFREGQHLVLTGGSPLKQQQNLVILIETFIERYGFKPYIEIENESVLMPSLKILHLVDQWNNSPKLESSGNTRRAAHKPDVLKCLSELGNSWFKFVVTDDEDWDEIKTNYLDTCLIKKEQIILMPQGQDREELNLTRGLTIDIAVKNNVRFSDREHIVVWDRKVGV